MGFLATGPAELDESRRKEAVEHVERVRAKVKSFKDRLLVAGLRGYPTESELSAASLEWPEDLPRAWGESEVDLKVLDQTLEQDSKAIVGEFFDLWSGDYGRDVLRRIDPDDPTRAIVFAGGPSWGDCPDGWGYETYVAAEILDLPLLLGIR